MQAEPSVCDPFTVPEVNTGDSMAKPQPETRVPTAPNNSGLDLTGASISLVTGEDGKPST